MLIISTNYKENIIGNTIQLPTKGLSRSTLNPLITQNTITIFDVCQSLLNVVKLSYFTI